MSKQIYTIKTISTSVTKCEKHVSTIRAISAIDERAAIIKAVTGSTAKTTYGVQYDSSTQVYTVTRRTAYGTAVIGKATIWGGSKPAVW